MLSFVVSNLEKKKSEKEGKNKWFVLGHNELEV